MTAQATPITSAPKVEPVIYSDADNNTLVALLEKRRAFYTQERKKLHAFLEDKLQHHDEQGVAACLTENAKEVIGLLKVWESK